MLRIFVHYGIHFLIPFVVAFIFYRKTFQISIFILLAGILIDIDHLFANPIFDPNRCSIGFHPLHSYVAIALYILLLLFSKTRIFGLALIIHIIADVCDCLMMPSN
ncbi:hypothetical protein SAMN05216480_10796 [Pustulibacterium marinum]|uniref:LexA-binding, inner membrane-associated hydrolase n=1 Tax=Pustulibacterium marinum TaxID=1224947 RepID=A0A1I7H5W1_9FLAO|nr:DUF6122 family protein [Pustulibacterium marinum]SFU56049.1 hypothetical protein SAMN05216480_10796 [Pustulibacterium marinum]